MSGKKRRAKKAGAWAGSVTEMEFQAPIVPQVIGLHAAPDAPNNPELPVLVYRGVINERVPGKDAIFQQHFMKNGWQGVWKNGIYEYLHFHPDAHEVLGIAKGSVTVQIGGDHGKILDLNAGDLIILPAGTGHKKITGSENLVVIGAYPPGQENYDICKSVGACEDAEGRIAGVPLPKTDPFYGTNGPLQQTWLKHDKD
jgi:uncharacterized protein YjlB